MDTAVDFKTQLNSTKERKLGTKWIVESLHFKNKSKKTWNRISEDIYDKKNGQLLLFLRKNKAGLFDLDYTTEGFLPELMKIFREWQGEFKVHFSGRLPYLEVRPEGKKENG